MTAAVGLQLLKSERAASAGYEQALVQADAAVLAAQAQGYSSEELAAIAAGLSSNRSKVVPMFFQQESFYVQRRAAVLNLLAHLPQVEAQALAQHRQTAEASIKDAIGAVESARTQGADPDQLAPLKLSLDKLAPALTAAATPRALDPLVAQAVEAARAAAAAGAAAAAERAQLAQAAEALKAQYAGNLNQVRAAGVGAIGPARNDGTVATMLKLNGTGSLVSRLEHYASLLPGTDLAQVALGAAGTQTYQRRIHDLLLSKMPAQTIALSLSAQELWAYQDGKVVQDTLITSGRPALPTDVGAMKVLWRQSPWKMHSPWPRSSPYWYPDTLVQKVVWFTVTGEGLHDASWEPVSLYGPGGQLTSSASHGCVHVLPAAEGFLYNWAKDGTPVIVYPGDGSSVADQMKQVTVDQNGVPFTGPKGA